jgi:hypothetical protein
MKQRLVSFKNGIVGLATLPETVNVAAGLVGGAIAGMGWVVAYNLERKLRTYETTGPDDWPSISVSPHVMNAVMTEGRTMQCRARSNRPNHLLIQTTVSDKFPASADETFFDKGETT